MISITFEAATLADLTLEMTQFLGDSRRESPVPAEQALVEKRKPGRPPKVKAPDPDPTPVPSAAPVLDPVQAEPSRDGGGTLVTYEAMRTKLQEVAVTGDGTGIKAAADIVRKFGYERIRDVKPEHYTAIYEAATSYLTVN